jgi:hypothetical protein
MTVASRVQPIGYLVKSGNALAAAPTDDSLSLLLIAAVALAAVTPSSSSVVMNSADGHGGTTVRLNVATIRPVSTSSLCTAHLF